MQHLYSRTVKKNEAAPACPAHPRITLPPQLLHLLPRQCLRARRRAQRSTATTYDTTAPRSPKQLSCGTRCGDARRVAAPQVSVFVLLYGEQVRLYQ